VKPPFTLSRGGLRLEADGSINVEVSANTDGTIEVLAPALERAGSSAWPLLVGEGPGRPWQRALARGSCRVVHFSEVLRPAARQDLGVESMGNGSRRWPLVLLVRPGACDGSPAAEDPPDGTLMACCTVRHGQLEVTRQLIAWGKGGATYVMKDLYGIQEAQGSGSVQLDNQKTCVVCLTSPKDTALMPCGHFCVCYECGASLRLTPARNRCPLCRREVEDIVHIDVAAPAEAGGSAAPSEAAEAPAAGSPAATGAGGPPPAQPGTCAPGLPPRCLQRLTRELRHAEEQRAGHLEEHGLRLALCDPQGEDLRAWSLHILSHAVDETCSLGRELRAHGVEAVELEVWIPDAFPVEPPLLRVIRPRFSQGSFFVHQHGALCLEILTRQGWTPAMSLPQLGVQVKTMMSQGSGTVSGPGAMGDPGPAGREAAWATSRLIESAHSDWQSFSTS